MKDRVVEEAVRDVLAEVLAGNRRLVVEQFDLDVAVVGLDRDHDASQV